MILNTARKILLARAAYQAVMLGRRLIGQGPELDTRRGGIRWHLDLREGIDFSIFLLGGFEPRTLRFYRQVVKPGDTVLDIGANVGAHTLPLAEIVGDAGQVVAFEPTAFAYRKLLTNIRLNPALAPRILARQVMLVADATQPLAPEIFSSWPLTGEQGLHEQHKGKLMSTSGAACLSLDQALVESGISRVDFVKLDVDGHEHEVISGGMKMLERFRPRLMMELAPYLFPEEIGAFERLVDCLGSLDYMLAEVDSGKALVMDASRLRSLIPHGASVNVIASPKRMRHDG